MKFQKHGEAVLWHDLHHVTTLEGLMGLLCCLGGGSAGPGGPGDRIAVAAEADPYEPGSGPGWVGSRDGREDRHHTVESFCENSGNIFYRMNLL